MVGLVLDILVSPFLSKWLATENEPEMRELNSRTTKLKLLKQKQIKERKGMLVFGCGGSCSDKVPSHIRRRAIFDYFLYSRRRARIFHIPAHHTQTTHATHTVRTSIQRASLLRLPIHQRKGPILFFFE